MVGTSPALPAPVGRYRHRPGWSCLCGLILALLVAGCRAPATTAGTAPPSATAPTGAADVPADYTYTPGPPPSAPVEPPLIAPTPPVGEQPPPGLTKSEQGQWWVRHNREQREARALQRGREPRTIEAQAQQASKVIAEVSSNVIPPQPAGGNPVPPTPKDQGGFGGYGPRASGSLRVGTGQPSVAAQPSLPNNGLPTIVYQPVENDAFEDGLPAHMGVVSVEGSEPGGFPAGSTHPSRRRFSSSPAYGSGRVRVRAYRRRDGTYVRSHTRGRGR